MERILEIPHDVWVNISSFIPTPVLYTLYGVNRSLFQIATSAKYEAVTFIKFDKDTKKLCRNLSDPFGRAAFVRHVQIKPWLVEHHVKSPQRREKWWYSVKKILDPNFEESMANQWLQKRLRKEIKYVTNAISGMRNLYEYSLERTQDDQPYQSEFYRAFLAPLLPCVQNTLVRLSIDVPPEMFRSLTPIALPRLEHLEVGICTQRLEKREIDELFDCFIVFVNNLFRSLESLSISSRVPSQSLDLTRIFLYLGFFPRLHTFSLSIPFDGVHLQSPSRLVSFLDKHRYTLRHLQLNTSRCSCPDSPVDPESKYWLRNILTSMRVPYPYLYDVQLAIRPIRADLTPFIRFLSNHAEELNSLALTDRALTYNETKNILDEIGAHQHQHRLKMLSLKVQHLSPALLELLATRIPRLVHLRLSFGEVTATAAHQGHNGTMQEEFALFEGEVRANAHVYASWDLRIMGLVQESRHARDAELSQLFSDCIPTLQSITSGS